MALEKEQGIIDKYHCGRTNPAGELRTDYIRLVALRKLEWGWYYLRRELWYGEES